MDSNIFVIIQARTTSTRLPQKVLKPLCNKSVLEVIFDRLKSFKDNIIIATTNDNTHKPIVDICKKHNIRYFEGSVKNVLQRYYQSAKFYGAKSGDIIVRVTSDCPFVDEDNIKRAIKLYTTKRLDYVWVDVTSSYPRGFDAEVFSFDRLKHAYFNAINDYDKEHVTPYFKSDKSLKMLPIKSEYNNSHYRLTLDTADDYKAIDELYKLLDNDTFVKYDKIIKTLKANPYISQINSNIIQKSR